MCLIIEGIQKIPVALLLRGRYKIVAKYYTTYNQQLKQKVKKNIQKANSSDRIYKIRNIIIIRKVIFLFQPMLVTTNGVRLYTKNPSHFFIGQL